MSSSGVSMAQPLANFTSSGSGSDDVPSPSSTSGSAGDALKEVSP